MALLVEDLRPLTKTELPLCEVCCTGCQTKIPVQVRTWLKIESAEAHWALTLPRTEWPLTKTTLEIQDRHLEPQQRKADCRAIREARVALLLQGLSPPSSSKSRFKDLCCLRRRVFTTCYADGQLIRVASICVMVFVNTRLHQPRARLHPRKWRTTL